MHSTIEGARSISAAFPPNPGFISWDFRGSRDGDRLSSGASGMTPSMLRTALPRSADISHTMPRLDDWRRDNHGPYQNSEIQYEGYLSRAKARQRSVPGRRHARRTHGLSAR